MTGTALPPVEVVSNAVLGPAVRSAARGRLRVIADTGAAKLRHFRSSSNDHATDRLDIEAPSFEEVATAPLIPGNVLWGGMLKDHFGHMASEGVHRLWAVRHLDDLSDAKVAFCVSRSHPGQLNDWFQRMVSWFGVDPANIILVNKVLRIERLFIPAQGQTLSGVQLVSDYKRLVPSGVKLADHGRCSSRIYVSRQLHIQGGTYLGETYVSSLLEEAGFTVVIPEQLKLEAMLTNIFVE